MKSKTLTVIAMALAAGLVFTSSPAMAATPKPKDVLVATLKTKCKTKVWNGTPDYVDKSQWSGVSPYMKGKTYYYTYVNVNGTGDSIVSVTMGAKSATVKLVNKDAKYEFGKNRNNCPVSMTVTYSFVNAVLQG
jgi:hypothetical protein